MKRIQLWAFALMGLLLAASCDNSETYADQKDRERAAISQFIAENNISVISETDFEAAGEVTDVSKNEYVLLNNIGVYMQIVSKGCGEKIQKGETTDVLCRFTERNLLTDTIQLSNNIVYYAYRPDKMSVTNTSGTFTASFVSGESVMATYYGTSVPSGWLAPLTYIKLGRPASDDDELARVRLIVPHTQGQQNASSGVYPCYYEITYERGR